MCTVHFDKHGMEAIYTLNTYNAFNYSQLRCNAYNASYYSERSTYTKHLMQTLHKSTKDTNLSFEQLYLVQVEVEFGLLQEVPSEAGAMQASIQGLETLGGSYRSLAQSLLHSVPSPPPPPVPSPPPPPVLRGGLARLAGPSMAR